MRATLIRIVTHFAASLVVALLSLPARAEGQLPDAPTPQYSQSQDVAQTQNDSDPHEQTSQHDMANEQIHAQEKQRIMLIMPNFNTSYINNAVSLTRKQKMQLAFRSAVDPFTFAGPLIVATFDVAFNEEPVFGPGAEGYFKHAGAAYLDVFDGIIIGNGILPSILHQDPRFFRLGHGSFQRRFFYAISTSFICKHDNGRWEPNFSNIGGNLSSGAISTLYYPSDESGMGRIASNAIIVTAEGAIMGTFTEFWPDISRRLFHKDPTNGRDAAVAAEDRKGKTQPVSPSHQ